MGPLTWGIVGKARLQVGRLRPEEGPQGVLRVEAASGSPALLLCWCVLPARGQWIRRLSLPPGEPSSCRACGGGGLFSSLVGALKSLR